MVAATVSLEHIDLYLQVSRTTGSNIVPQHRKVDPLTCTVYPILHLFDREFIFLVILISPLSSFYNLPPIRLWHLMNRPISLPLCT